MERDSRPRLKDSLQPSITVRQLDILRLLGKGNSFREIFQQFSDQDSGVDVGKELREICKAFGVSGETATVVHALNLGLLKTGELVDENYDWSLFDDLKPKQISILESFTHASDEILSEEECSRLGVVSQTPKTYISNSITSIREKILLKNKTQAVVYYCAWRKKQQNVLLH